MNEIKPNDMLDEYMPHEILHLFDDISDGLQSKIQGRIVPMYSDMTIIEVGEVGISIALYWSEFTKEEKLELNEIVEDGY